MENKLLFTTKDLFKNTWIIFWIIFIIVTCPIVVAYTPMGWLLLLFCAICYSIPIINTIALKKSYANIYSDYIEGVALPTNLFGALNNMPSFKISYNEITQITFKKDIVTINFIGGQYNFQAHGVEETVVKIIREQKELAQK